jgi:predicted HAD superfamily Cof-like phosphohydrolase
MDSDYASNDNDLLSTFDSRIWAERFVQRVKKNPSIATDTGTMLAWFAGAIMSGYDHRERMQSNYFEDVQDFHKRVVELDTADTPSVPAPERVALRIKLMKEELNELLDGIAFNNMVEIADGCADLVVVVLGTADEYGIPFDRVWKEVHRSNMAKMGGEVRADGKKLKPPGWTPPDIDAVLKGKL